MAQNSFPPSVVSDIAVCTRGKYPSVRTALMLVKFVMFQIGKFMLGVKNYWGGVKVCIFV